MQLEAGLSKVLILEPKLEQMRRLLHLPHIPFASHKEQPQSAAARSSLGVSVSPSSPAPTEESGKGGGPLREGFLALNCRR